jgi:hypothetical protein
MSHYVSLLCALKMSLSSSPRHVDVTRERAGAIRGQHPVQVGPGAVRQQRGRDDLGGCGRRKMSVRGVVFEEGEWRELC